MKTNTQYIDGVFTSPVGAIFERRCPATTLPFSITYIADALQIDQAVTGARSAFYSWSRLSMAERSSFVLKMADWLQDAYGSAGEQTWIKALISAEVGKLSPEADIEVIETADFIRYFANTAQTTMTSREVVLDNSLWPTKKSLVSRCPLGVVAIIKPWNYPLEMIGWSLAPALLAGNTVVIKSSERSPTVANIYARMASEIGFPPGVIQVVHGDKATAEALIVHSQVDMVSFTGSVVTGCDVASACGRFGKRSLLELGGNDAAIVLSDADLELAANGIVWGAFCNAGQVCVGVKRVLVHKAVEAKFVELVVAKTRELVLGRDIAPLIDDVQVNVVLEFIKDAVERGASVLTGGKHGIANTSGYYVEPTVISNVSDGMTLWGNECFGPLLPIMVFDRDVDAVRLANDSRYGLGASIWSRDIIKAQALSADINVGMIWINDVNVAFPQTPWAGWKASGRCFELSSEAISEYSQFKHLNWDMSLENRRAWWYPYEG